MELQNVLNNRRSMRNYDAAKKVEEFTDIKILLHFIR